MKLLRSRRRNADTLMTSLGSIREELRRGASLRVALSNAAEQFAGLAFLRQYLRKGVSVHSSLLEASNASTDLVLARVLRVCALNSRGGGNCTQVLDRALQSLREHDATRREAKSLTTQARMSAWAILMMSPGFVLLLALTDPASMKASFSGVGRAAIILGVVMQIVGTAWMTRIVSSAIDPSPPGRILRLPGLRAVRGLITGNLRPRSSVPLEVAETADAMAELCEAGLGTLTALKTVAPTAGGELGDALKKWLLASNTAASWRSELSNVLGALGQDEAFHLASVIDGSTRSGSPAGPDLRELASFIRRNEQTALVESVRAASLKVLLPVCFLVLPAFVLICLVPLMVSGFTGLGI